MKNSIKIAGAAIMAAALTQLASAAPIIGNIGFSGAATLNSGNLSTATEVVAWGTNSVNAESGTFATFGGGIPLGTQVTLAAPWTFNTGNPPGLASFWQVGGFTFNLLTSTSSIASLGGQTFLLASITGTVSGNGFSVTDFTGSFSTQTPASDGETKFTESFSFAPAPDGGTTVLLLGTALSGLALLKRKLMA